MLLRSDLGLLCSIVVVVVVGWLLARRKWRRAAARKEEIRRLMAFASAETARVELEAAAGYSSYGSALAPEPAAEEPGLGFGPTPGRQLQYQCELCFSPTTTRCKQCKAVHYCSRKCQIIHWRQGHKNECHSLVTQRKTDEGSLSCLKDFKQDEIQSNRNVIGIEMAHSAKTVESSSGECLFSNPSLNGLGENNDTEINDNWKRTDTDTKGDDLVQSLHNELSSSTVSVEMPVALDSNVKDHNRYNELSTSMNVEATKPLASEPNPEYHVAASNFLNQLKSGCINIDDKSEASTSSSCSSAVSEDHSLSEPSTPSDFWEGTVEPIRSKIHAIDEFCDSNMLNSRSSSGPSSEGIDAHVEKLGSDMNRVMPDGTCPATSMPKKSEVIEDGLKPSGSLVLNCKLSGQNDVTNTSTKCTSKDLISKGHVSSKHDVDAEHLDHEIGATNGSLNTMKCQGGDSLRVRSSGAHLASSSCTKETDCVRGDASSVENSGYVRSSANVTNPSVRKVVDHFRVSNSIMRGSVGAGNGSMGKYEGSFPYELFVKLYNSNKVELCPCGLVNCGNSCYANAVLQCLAFTPPLTAYFLQGLHAKGCRKKEWCFTCDFEALVKKSKEGDSPISPARMMSQMQHLGIHLGNGREEDAHEFLRCAIDAMQLACLKEAGIKVPSSLDEETTLLGLTFGGYLESKIECTRCGGKSKQHERIMDLSVEIGGGEIETLEDALRQFTRSEMLDGENKYHCCRCKSYEKAKKKLRVLEAPNVLTVALKRFQSGKFGKLNKAVKFPDILNLAPYMSGTSDKSPIYQLYGIVVHLDVMNATFSGHYICYIKNNAGRWFKADDSQVKEVELENVVSKDAYMLFYARCSPRAPRLIRSSVAPREHSRKAKNQNWNFKSHPSNPWDVSMSRSSGHNTSNGFPHTKSTFVEEDDILSEYSSSFFSDGGSHSTESSNRGSTSTDDSFDQILFCSDATSLTSSSSSSSSSSGNVSSNRRDGEGFWAHKGRGTILSNKKDSVGSDRKNESCNRLGSNKSGDNVNVVYLRTSVS